MARVVFGSRGATWRAPEWIVRNFFAEVATVLRSIGGSGIAAQRLADKLSADDVLIDLTTMLDDPQVRGLWLHALDTAFLLLSGEPPEDWNEPHAFAPFVGSVRRFLDAEHARPSVESMGAGFDAQDVLVSNLAWIFDDRLDG